jgi:poly(A) polymerase
MYLPSRPWIAAASTRAVIAALEAKGGRGCARFVGGCVRDTLLERDGPELDIDIATPLTPTEVTAALEAAGLKAVPTGIEHGTVTAVAQGRPFEITTLRRDVETDGRRAVVAFTKDWADDAARRDFRLNALYAEPDGRLHDPTGGGVEDAHAGRIVFVGDAATRIAEDYLRILRFFRFYAAYGRGEPDAAGLAACAALRQGLLGLSGERTAKELLKLLAASDPRPALAAMAQTGVLGVLLPGADDLARLNGLVEVEGAPPDAVLRLSALLPNDRDRLLLAFARLRLANATRDRLLAALPDETPVAPDMTAQAARAAIYRLGRATFADRVQLAWAGAPSLESASWAALLDLAQTWTPPPFPLNGADIKALGVAEGRELGELRRALEAWWVAQDFIPDRQAALAELRARVAQPISAHPRESGDPGL